jgi:DNA-binding transcriptional MocR family regulator
LVRIAVDAQGLDVSRLPSAARLAYVTPCHQFPERVILPLERRLALLDWAERTDAWVIEDDYVSEFRYEGSPLEALQALDRNGRVLYIGTFSKTLFPALRLAYSSCRAPGAPFLAAKWAADRFSRCSRRRRSRIHRERPVRALLRRAGARNAAKRRTLIAALRQHFGARVEIAGENTGVHLMVWLNDVRPRDLIRSLRVPARAGVRPLLDRALLRAAPAAGRAAVRLRLAERGRNPRRHPPAGGRGELNDLVLEQRHAAAGTGPESARSPRCGAVVHQPLQRERGEPIAISAPQAKS